MQQARWNGEPGAPPAQPPSWAGVDAAFSVNRIFTDNMVLQRERRNTVWGRALPGSEIGVAIGGRRYGAIADPAGRWQVEMEPLPVGGPYTMTLVGAGREITLCNILCGDVWICSGQSNMWWPLGAIDPAGKLAAGADYPRIRLFDIPQLSAASAAPQEDLPGCSGWRECDPKQVETFSAVGYFFGRELHRELDLPIGLINASWGGARIEAYTSLAALKANPALEPLIRAFEDVTLRDAGLSATWRESEKNAYAWPYPDPGITPVEAGWMAPGCDDADWQTVALPFGAGGWERALGWDMDGAVWFRRAIEVPLEWAGRDLELSLGKLDDFDITFWNGGQVGATDIRTPNAYQVPRRYRIAGALVKPGRAVFAVRVFDHWGAGGFTGAAHELQLAPVGGGPALSLAGPWKARIALNYPSLGNDWWSWPGVLFNTMIHPILRFGVRGVAWYQGESNVDAPDSYAELLTTLINDWRHRFGGEGLPFLVVQLANYGAVTDVPGESAWAEVREAQACAARRLREVGLVVTIDVGEGDNIHPRDKEPVGKRLALAALNIAYGRAVVHSGPVFRDMRREGAAIRLRFDHVGSGLMVKHGDSPIGFSVAGEDGVFVWAQARLEGDSVVVWHSGIPNPTAVRYAWANNPQGCNLYNREGLPAAPFRVTPL